MKQKRIRTTRIATIGTIAFVAVVTALPALAADASQHLRGQITAVSDNGFTMTTKSGDQRQIVLSSSTKIAAVTKGDLSNIEKGTFIGTANVKKNGQNQALEMVIFPPSMKGTGLGDYSWDLSPAMADDQGNQASQTAGSDSSMAAGSSMTNGTVSAKPRGAMATSQTAGSSMTNGSVTSQSGSGQSITLQVDYGKGSKTIVVPADVPTVKVQPGSRSDIKTGAHVFVAGPKSSGKFSAERVIVGRDGTVPPM